ncbi:hypothetical protein, partial [Mycobacterium sp.]|uniref:hypothetical protein n=1 Tax=Mycobacterium sp. TaxID=1785 RepID=UPI003BAE4B96
WHPSELNRWMKATGPEGTVSLKGRCASSASGTPSAAADTSGAAAASTSPRHRSTAFDAQRVTSALAL